MTDGHGLAPSSIESIAGFTAGTVSTLAVHPLDIIKTRLQIDRHTKNQFGTSWRVARDIVQNEGSKGIIAAFYRGLIPNVVGNSLGWSLYFLWYRQAQDVIHKMHGHQEGAETTARLSSTDYLMASSAAGALSALCINPIWVVKTRMLSTSATHAGAYPSMLAGLRTLFAQEGIRGYYRGFIPALAGVSHGALYFVAYEKLKQSRFDQPGRADTRLSNYEYLVISALAKIWAGVLTYPHQVVRARLQAYRQEAAAYRGVVDTIRQIWWHEGALGFYKGILPNTFRVLPSTCVTFIVYENVKWSLSRPVKQNAVY